MRTPIIVCCLLVDYITTPTVNTVHISYLTHISHCTHPHTQHTPCTANTPSHCTHLHTAHTLTQHTHHILQTLHCTPLTVHTPHNSHTSQYCVVDKERGELMIQEQSLPQPRKLENLMLCNTRPCKPEFIDRNFCFRVSLLREEGVYHHGNMCGTY